MLTQPVFNRNKETLGMTLCVHTFDLCSVVLQFTFPNLLGHTGHDRKGHLGGNAQAGQKGSRGCAAVDPAGTSDGSLKHITHPTSQVLIHTARSFIAYSMHVHNFLAIRNPLY